MNSCFHNSRLFPCEAAHKDDEFFFFWDTQFSPEGVHFGSGPKVFCINAVGYKRDLLEGVVHGLSQPVDHRGTDRDHFGTAIQKTAQSASRIKLAVDSCHGRYQCLFAHLDSHLQGSDGMGVNQVHIPGLYQFFRLFQQNLVLGVNWIVGLERQLRDLYPAVQKGVKQIAASGTDHNCDAHFLEPFGKAKDVSFCASDVQLVNQHQNG